MLLRPGQLWGLRFMALGALLLLAAVIGGLVLVFGGGEDDDERGGQAGAPDIELPQGVNEKASGISAGYPEGWTRSERNGIINLESPDRCVAIALSAPVAAAQAAPLLEDTVDSLRNSFGKVKAGKEQSPQQIGGLPTASALVAVRAKSGNPVIIRASVGRGDKFAYLTQVVVRNPQCTDSVEDSRAILASIDYSR